MDADKCSLAVEVEHLESAMDGLRREQADAIVDLRRRLAAAGREAVASREAAAAAERDKDVEAARTLSEKRILQRVAKESKEARAKAERLAKSAVERASAAEEALEAFERDRDRRLRDARGVQRSELPGLALPDDPGERETELTRRLGQAVEDLRKAEKAAAVAKADKKAVVDAAKVCAHAAVGRAGARGNLSSPHQPPTLDAPWAGLLALACTSMLPNAALPSCAAARHRSHAPAVTRHSVQSLRRRGQRLMSSRTTPGAGSKIGRVRGMPPQVTTPRPCGGYGKRRPPSIACATQWMTTPRGRRR